MKFTASLAAELATLNAALDKPGSDIGEGLRQLAALVTAAVPSYLGLSVVAAQHDSSSTVTLLEDGVTAGDVGTSILLAWPNPGDGHDVATVAFILYARSPGAFVDLAADVAWLTESPPTEFMLDAHLGVAAEPDTASSMAAASVINQAIGVLIGRGYTTRQALWALDAQAAGGESNRLKAAHVILGRLTPGDDD